MVAGRAAFAQQPRGFTAITDAMSVDHLDREIRTFLTSPAVLTAGAPTAIVLFFFLRTRPPPRSPLFPSTTLFRSSRVAPRGPPPPFGIDPTACYDTKRDRIYVGGGSYPVAPGPNAFWAYDVRTDTWIDPKPEIGRAHV